MPVYLQLLPQVSAASDPVPPSKRSKPISKHKSVPYNVKATAVRDILAGRKSQADVARELDLFKAAVSALDQEWRQNSRSCCQQTYGFSANLNDACAISNACWEAVTPETIVNCMIKADCFPEIVAKQIAATDTEGT